MGRGRKGRDNKQFRHGMCAGWNEYRYGSAKPVTLPRVFQGDKRRHVVSRVMDMLRDWRTSPFEYEGTVRASVRSGLCMQGHKWAVADEEAAYLLEESFRLLGVKRPTWEQGQREYADPAENCRWCARPIEGQEKTTRRLFFCSEECGRTAFHKRDYEDGWRHSAVGRAAYEMIERSRATARSCKHCGQMFKPRRDGVDQDYCSQPCFRAASTYLPDRKCRQCGKMFHVRTARRTSNYCSQECYNKQRKAGFAATCEWCSKRFTAHNPHTKYCSDNCRHCISGIKSGKWEPKRVTPPVFDYVFTRPIEDFQRTGVTPQRLDGLFVEMGARVTAEVRIAA